jgi:tryptophanyl-tRNA synthetase
MAADILLYDTQAVPVGEDQKQHLELARDLAERFNRDFGQTFVVPKPIINIASGRILALDNPEIKMSKSAASTKNYISLMDEADVIRKKIKSAVTDSEAGITVDDGRPGLKNLLAIFSLVTQESKEDLANKYAGKGMKELKEDLAEALIYHLTPLQALINRHLSQPDELERIVAEGSARANEIAAKKIAEVKAKMGLSL